MVVDNELFEQLESCFKHMAFCLKKFGSIDPPKKKEKEKFHHSEYYPVHGECEEKQKVKYAGIRTTHCSLSGSRRGVNVFGPYGSFENAVKTIEDFRS